jgi:hypothetical protein
MSNGNQHAVRSTAFFSLEKTMPPTPALPPWPCISFPQKDKAGASLYDGCLLIKACIHTPHTATQAHARHTTEKLISDRFLRSDAPAVSGEKPVDKAPGYHPTPISNRHFRSPPLTHSLPRSLTRLHQVTRQFQRSVHHPDVPQRVSLGCGH